jgi:hypothetical protein
MRFRQLLLSVSVIGSAFGAESIMPDQLSFGDLEEDPYLYNALLSSRGYTGSASLIGDGLFATATHVVFDEVSLQWVPASAIHFVLRHHRTLRNPPVGRSFTPAGIVRWTSYSDRVGNDGTEEEFSSRDTFNLDFAVGYFSATVDNSYLDRWAEVHIDAEEEVGILRDQRVTTIVGYPADAEFMDPNAIGFMHGTPPEPLFAWWHGLNDFPDTWRDSGGFWFSLHNFEGVSVYGGNSGGPVYVRGDFDEWLFAGVVVGGNRERTLVRAFDEEAHLLLREAAEARGDPGLRRAAGLAAEAEGPRAARLHWTDTSATETAWRILRRDTGTPEEIARLPANSREFIDTTVLPGRVYKYEVQPEDADGNRAPASATAVVATPGQARDLAVAVGNGALALTNGGDRNWFAADGGLRSGDIRDMGESRLRMRLLGPGTLRFDWRVSSEENSTWTPTNGEDIYDAVHLYLNGESVEESGRPVFLSGTRGPEAVELEVPAGGHLVEWVYRKDPYSTEGDDAGFLANLSWTPGPSHPSPVHGSYAFADTDYHGSAWFGAYAADRLPWAGHLELGWLFLRAAPGDGVYAYSPLPELGDFYTGPELYPYLYRLSDGAWLYYYEGTGTFGSGAWFTDLGGGGHFRLP